VSNELIISSTETGERIALLQDKKLLEYHLDSRAEFNVGDVYLGIIRKVNPGLNASFVDIGHEKEAFLHFPDLGPQVLSLSRFARQKREGLLGSNAMEKFELDKELVRDGKIVDVFQKGQLMPVQILKEPISTKGYRLTTEISIPGRYLVLVPFSNSVSISKKIEDRVERKRLLDLIKSLRPNNYGVIIRTVAEGVELEDVQRDLLSLVDKWEVAMDALQNAEPKQRIIGEMSKASALMRDLLNDNFDRILVDTKESYNALKDFVRDIAPDKEGIVKLHNSKTLLFEAAGVEKQLRMLFGKSVSLPSGGYLVIEHTEAMHVIDVNSGSSTSKSGSGDYESNSLNVNLEAAREVARQLRLRDIGGIVIIDFIDMRRPEFRRQLQETMEQEMVPDRAKHTVLPLSKFGLMQITRQRVRPEMNIVTVEVCPTCNGTGKVQASIAAEDMLESAVASVLGSQNEKNITIEIHPFLHAYFTKGIMSRQVKWFIEYKTWVKLVIDSSLGLAEFRIKNKKGETIEI
jgi:ribonuclease G